MTPAPFSHGPGGYTNHGCRCEVCRVGNTAYMRQWRARKRPEDAPVHGSSSTYVNYGCRCEACTAAHRARSRSTNLYIPVDVTERLELVAAALGVPARQLAVDLLWAALQAKENR